MPLERVNVEVMSTGEHLTEREVELFRRRALNSAERRRLDAHLSACADCLRQVLGPEHSGLAFDALAEAFLPPADEGAFHLSREELQKYAAGSADEADRIICESHFELCESCEAAARSLSEAAPNIAPAHDGARLDAGTPSPRQGVTATWHAPAWLTPARAAAAAFALLLSVGLLWYQSRPDRTISQATRTTSGETSPSPASSPASQDIPNAAGPTKDEAALSESGGDSQTGNREAPTESPPGRRGVDGPPIVASLLDNGREVKLDGSGKLVGLNGLTPSARTAVKTVLTDGSLPKPRVLEELSAPAIKLLGRPGGEPSFELKSPLGVGVVADRPTLRWRPLGGADSYTVSVFDPEFNRVARSAPQTATEWRVPLPLRRGGVYSWEVTALKDGREITSPVAPAPRAQFKILEAERLEELAAVEKSRAPSRLALGVMYARSGLLDEAEREFQKLVKENPRSRLARRLLRTVRGWRSR